MKIIEFTDPHRKKHFNHFNSMSYPHFQVTSSISVTSLIKYIKREGFHFTSAIVYWLSKVAHEIPQLRWRIRKEIIVEHDRLDPSFAVMPDVSDVFSFCTVEYDPNWYIFENRSLATIKKMRSNPSFEDEEGKDNFLFMSALPWVSFTGIQHPVSMPVDSVPRITWGKSQIVGVEEMLPLAIQAHHALVDGKDLGLFFEKCVAYASTPQLLYNSDK
jgi:chloramphenicol O-acetyltransferase type A